MNLSMREGSELERWILASYAQEVICETLRMVVIDTEDYGMKRESACGQNHGEQPVILST